MSGVRAIADELAAKVAAALGDNISQVSGRRIFSPTPPTIDIYPADTFRADVGRGFGDLGGALIFVVRARVNSADNEAAQDLLLDLMDDESDVCVAAALADDQTLNGLASTIEVDGPTGFRVYDDLGHTQAFIGCEWTVTIVNRAS
jgi:hypothetical protein